MTPTTTRRALLAGGTMLLAGRAAGQQATTLKLYSAVYEIEAAMLSNEVEERTHGRYNLEQIIGFDMLTARWARSAWRAASMRCSMACTRATSICHRALS